MDGIVVISQWSGQPCSCTWVVVRSPLLSLEQRGSGCCSVFSGYLSLASLGKQGTRQGEAVPVRRALTRFCTDLRFLSPAAGTGVCWAPQCCGTVAGTTLSRLLLADTFLESFFKVVFFLKRVPGFCLVT